MDSGKLPNYKSSYLLRFHPYPRVKPSARERAMATLEAADEYSISSYDGVSTPSFQSTDFDDAAFGTTQNLNNAIHIMQSLDFRHRRRLSFSSLVVDLALLARKPPSGA